ncbi:MAG: hypothetical protein ACT4OI_07135 [Methanobacteriota archaeon]
METKPPRPAAWSDSLLPAATRFLVLAVAAEFLILRILNRMTGSFPAWAREQVAVDLVLVGTVAYNLGYLLSILVLAAVGDVLLRRSDRLGYAIVLWIPVLVAVHLLGASAPPIVVAADLFAAVLMAWLVLRDVRRQRTRPWAAATPRRHAVVAVHLARVAFPVLVLAAYAASLYLRAGDALATLGANGPARAEVYRIGETFAVAAAFVAPTLAGRRVAWRDLVVPIAAVGTLAALSAARPDILPLIGYWSLGFQVVLPFPVYLVAVGAFLYALVAAKGSGRVHVANGLLVLFLAGRLLADFYFIELALVALVLLTLGDALPSAAPLAPSTGTDPRREPSGKVGA